MALKKRIIVVPFAVLLIAVSALVYRGQRRERSAALFYSGTIEATESELSFQVTGRVTQVLVDEGYSVQKGQVLAALDRSEYQARFAEAQAYVNKAMETVRQLELQLEIFQETLPAEVARASANLTSSQDTFEQARKDKERYDNLVEGGLVSTQAWEIAVLNYDLAQARLTESKAVLAQAQSNLKKMEATQREIEVARAQVGVAQAALELTRIQLDYTSLLAPFAGIITVRQVEPGEVVSPNQEVFTLADLSMTDLKIFIPETDLGYIKPGQPVAVRVDTFPDTVYHGHVSYISPEGEFTPKIIQTHEERVKLVYLVKVAIPNPSLELKTGMPADAWLQEREPRP